MPCASSGSVGGPTRTWSELKLAPSTTISSSTSSPINTRSQTSGRLIQVTVSDVRWAIASSSRTTRASPEPSKRLSTRRASCSIVRSIWSASRAR